MRAVSRYAAPAMVDRSLATPILRHFLKQHQRSYHDFARSADRTAMAAPPAGDDIDAVVQAAHVPHRWRNLAIMSGVEVVDNTEAGVLPTVFPAIAKSLGLDNGHLGVLSALGKLVAIPMGPAWVWLGARRGRKQALIATTVLGGLFGFAAGFAHDYLTLLLWNTLMSAALIGGTPLTNAIIADSFDDRHRAKATGWYYAIITAVPAVVGPLAALLTRDPEGWRIAMMIIGGLCIVVAVLIGTLYRDPGVGAAEPQLADLSQRGRTTQRVTWASVAALFRIPTYAIMMVSRLLSGHLLVSVFGVQFLVAEEGFSNAVAAIVLIPFGLGFAVGTVGGGRMVSWLDRSAPRTGRVAFLIGAQVLFAVAAFFATQFDYPTIQLYGVFWALMGVTQGMNPPVNRPIVMAVVVPELRGQAMAVWLTGFQTVGWVLFSLIAGSLADRIGLQAVFLWILVILMLVNAVVLLPLFRLYPRDVSGVTAELERRRVLARSQQSI